MGCTRAKSELHAARYAVVLRLAEMRQDSLFFSRAYVTAITFVMEPGGERHGGLQRFWQNSLKPGTKVSAMWPGILLPSYPYFPSFLAHVTQELEHIMCLLAHFTSLEIPQSRPSFHLMDPKFILSLRRVLQTKVPH